MSYCYGELILFHEILRCTTLACVLEFSTPTSCYIKSNLSVKHCLLFPGIMRCGWSHIIRYRLSLHMSMLVPASSPAQYFSRTQCDERRTDMQKTRPGTHCRGNSAYAHSLQCIPGRVFHASVLLYPCVLASSRIHVRIREITTSPESGEVVISCNIFAILYRILVRLVKHFHAWSPLELTFNSKRCYHLCPHCA